MADATDADNYTGYSLIWSCLPFFRQVIVIASLLLLLPYSFAICECMHDYYWVLSDSSGRRGGSIGIDMDSASVLSSLSSRFGCASMFQLKLSLSLPLVLCLAFNRIDKRVTVLSVLLQLSFA